HPLPDSRLSDARNRANQMKPHPTASSQDYLFAKMRILGMYGADENSLTPELLDKLSKGTVREQLAAKYGQAVQLYQAKKYDEARNLLQPLLAQQPGNIWFLDLMTDIDLGQNKSAAAIARLQNAMVKQNDEPVLQLNLANAYVQGRQPAAAIKLLHRYTFAYPNDPNGWDLLAQATATQGLRDQELAARAESLALSGKLTQAIGLLSDASARVKLGSLEQARYDARIDQLRRLNERFRKYQKS
ncbi:tetratricopeptide repeat protein, partial [Yersinia pestis]